MPPPTDVLDAAERLSAIYRVALAAIRADLARAMTEPNRARLRRRLRELERTVTRLLSEADSQARFWIDSDLPRIYARGMGGFVTRSASVVGAPTDAVLSSFAMPSRPAIERLAAGLTDDLLSATAYVGRSAKRKLRQAASDASLAKLVEGRSLREAQRDLGDALDDLGLGTVRYANGTSMPLDAYASMAVRSVTAHAYNGGMTDAGRANGVEWFEVFDGPGCGWTEHDDDDVADGSIRHIDDCEANPTAHPNCLRSFGPRPDVTSDEEAANAAPLGAEPAGESVPESVALSARETRQAARRRRSDARDARRPASV